MKPYNTEQTKKEEVREMFDKIGRASCRERVCDLV